MKELIDDVLNDVIEPSWASPVVLIPRRVGKPRVCIDFRKVNENTVTDAYHIPTIREILDSLSGAVFSSLDLNSGYWQVEVDPEVRQIIAFICPQCLFQFRGHPHGNSFVCKYFASFWPIIHMDPVNALPVNALFWNLVSGWKKSENEALAFLCGQECPPRRATRRATRRRFWVRG